MTQYTYDFMKSPDPKIIVAADAKKPTETVAARAFSLAESNFWLRNLKIRDYEALFARTIEDTNHPHLFNHDTPLGTAPKSRKRSITSQKATIWPFFAIFSSENTFYLVPRGCGSIKGVPWNHLTISKTFPNKFILTNFWSPSSPKFDIFPQKWAKKGHFFAKNRFFALSWTGNDPPPLF